jgi:hypothetical protein
MTCQLLICCLLIGVSAARADVVLYDWCFNQNGNISLSCNGAGPAPAGFDATLVPATNGLGSASFTVNPGEFIAFYADYDLDYARFGSFQDSAAVRGTLPAGWSYELDDPNVSNIFNDFSANLLTNGNNVSTPAGPPDVCCDVSWALSIGGLASPSTVTFNITSTDPGSGFEIQQTNFDIGDSIYLSATVTPLTTPSVPEPSSLVLMATLFVGALAVTRRRLRT